MDSNSHKSPVLLSKSRVSHEFTIIYYFRTLAAASARSDNSDGPMSDPSIAIAEAFKHFSQATVSAVWRNTFHNSPVHSFQLHAYEQGTRARLNQTHDDIRALQREGDDALRDLNASKGQIRVWVEEADKCKSEARPLSCISLHSVVTLALTAGGECVDHGEAHVRSPSLPIFNRPTGSM